MGLRVVRLVLGVVLLAAAAATALVVAAGGGGVGVDLEWPAVGLAWRPTALLLFLLGAAALLVAEVAARLVLRALPGRDGGDDGRPGGRRRGRRAAR